jgi:hypothetical protein
VRASSVRPTRRLAAKGSLSSSPRPRGAASHWLRHQEEDAGNGGGPHSFLYAFNNLFNLQSSPVGCLSNIAHLRNNSGISQRRRVGTPSITGRSVQDLTSRRTNCGALSTLTNRTGPRNHALSVSVVRLAEVRSERWELVPVQPQHRLASQPPSCWQQVEANKLENHRAKDEKVMSQCAEINWSDPRAYAPDGA